MQETKSQAVELKQLRVLSEDSDGTLDALRERLSATKRELNECVLKCDGQELEIQKVRTQQYADLDNVPRKLPAPADIEDCTRKFFMYLCLRLRLLN